MWAQDLPEQPAGSTRIYLCRHGETEFNRTHVLQGGGVDSPLTPAGEAQARQLGTALSHVSFGALVSSTQPRSIRTADIMLSSLPSGHAFTVQRVALPAFKELHCGGLEGRALVEIREALREVSTCWNMGMLHAPVDPRGESPVDVLKRVQAGLREVVEMPKGKGSGNVVIVAHSNLNKILLANVDGSQRKIFAVKQGNACINVIDVVGTEAEEIRVVRTNIVEHLQDERNRL